MQNSLDITTLIFLALAVFVIWRLRSVLGQKTGFERPPERPFERPAEMGRKPANEDNPGNIIRLPGAPVPAPEPQDRWKGIAEAGSPLIKGLDDIASKEPGFDARAFLEGAKAAYETIVLAFAKGDRQTLQGLLSREVYEGFEKAIQDRETKGESVETTLVSFERATLDSVEVHGRVAQVTVRFLAKMITVTKDKAGQVVDGSVDAISDVTDIWTFARTLAARDPTWQLVATESGN